MRRAIGLVAAAVLGLTGCGGGDGDGDGGSDGGGGSGPNASNYPIPTTPLSGKIGGSDWTLVAAETDAFLSNADGFWVAAYGEPLGDNTCGFGPPTLENHLLLTVPPMPGDYPLGLSRTVTFLLELETASTDNLATTQGRLRVDEITADVIRGGAYARYDDDNVVSGTFSIAICKE